MKKKSRGRPEVYHSEYCSLAIHNFSRRLKNRYIAYCRLKGMTMGDHLEYLIAKLLREEGFAINAKKD